MASPFYSYTIATFTRGLETLDYILRKGEQHAEEHNIPLSELLHARITEDMQPLAFQVVTATNNIGKALARLASVDIPPQYPPDETYQELYSRIEKYVVELRAVDADMCAGREGKAFEAPIGTQTYQYTLEEYSVRFSIPNFYFHLVTAYDILRAKGVNIGKLDFLAQFTA
ncbi:unnamed protein product [Penicillium salamii]|uniref:DUF1993 domain-containing protein n=1 Tax=Penicillium salamii TaxID=1612424 RepID=A0A9W4JMJ1_9EURO|nr:unnamed protein product [Penicillium salamii]CAG8300326.1 unnamed protein product [Penicillium salamii]CAG8353719.1 unnamed protein product [Penicillium salamii]CAG8359724.1 unnamed protein product [Penicillium salamii]CAG8367813.1 unnamed protein product [Penicillium salamii]